MFQTKLEQTSETFMFIIQPLNPNVAADGWSYACTYIFVYLLFFPIDHYKMTMDLSTGYYNSKITLNLTLNSLTWKIWWAPNNASRWQMGFNSAFKGLEVITLHTDIKTTCNTIQMP